MSDKNSVEQLEERIEALEIKVAYQEETIQTLSDEIYKQQQEIEQMLVRHHRLTEKLEELQDSVPPSQGHEVPPHY